MNNKFHKDWFRHSEVEKGNLQIHRQHGDLISLVLSFQKKESMLKMSNEMLI
jgi:hypothetical protein